MTTPRPAGDHAMAASPLLPPTVAPPRRADDRDRVAGPSGSHRGEAVVVRIDSRAIPASPRPTAAQFRRRRIIAAAVGVLLVLLVAMTARAAGASPTTPDPIVGGHAVVEPGMTLWDVADQHAPAGEDVRHYLHDLRELNGVDAAVAPWTVVALPPR